MSQADNLAATPFDTHGSASPPQPHPVSDSSQVSLPAAQVRNGAHHTNDHTNALEANSSHTDSFKSTEKPLLKFFKQKATEPREWKTSLIRFGPLSGIFCMLLAIISIIASLGILAGSDNQPVADWSAPPSTYLAIFTAIANLSIRYAALQGVVVAWWFRALRGSTLDKLHLDWRAGTTLRGALTSGRRMGLLGLACIFSVVVVVDGPLLQRASTVKSSPIVDATASLRISLAPELPRDYSGAWGPWSAPDFSGFNDTIPSIHGPVSNYIQGYPLEGFLDPKTSATFFSREVTQLWYSDGPIAGAVQGCEGKVCRAKIWAPALVPTCRAHTIDIDSTQPWDWQAALRAHSAPPVYARGLIISTQLVVSSEKEWIDLVVMNSVMEPTGCTGVLQITLCALESGIGEYDVDIINDEIHMRGLQMPTSTVLANNSQVNHTAVPPRGVHPSTLGGISNMGWQRWNSILFRYPDGNTTASAFGGTVPWSLLVEGDTANYQCSSYRNITDEILISMNKLLIYTGAHVATQAGIQDQIELDPGLSLHNNATGQIVGDESKWHTDYWFFLAAAVVEVVCIVLIAPTYWGWWKLGRSVSLSPLELAKAFESPMLASSNSNSSGRDIAKTYADVRVQYGAVGTDDDDGRIEHHRKLAFASPEAVANPQNGSRFTV